MQSVLSQNEREALSRFLAKLVEDVDKVANLFESRGVDATSTRSAQSQLESTLHELQHSDSAEAADLEQDLRGVRARVPGDL